MGAVERGTLGLAPGVQPGKAMAKQRIGEILVKLGYLSPPQLEGALVHQRQWGFGLGRSAVICGFCTEEQVITALSRQLGLPAIDLDKVDLGSSFAPHVPERIAVQHCVVPLRTTGPRSEVLVVAMAPPASLVSQDVVRAIARKSRLEVYLASDEAIQRGIARLYRGAQAPAPAAQPQIEVGALGAVAEAPTPPQAELVEQLGLTPIARQAVEAVAAQHGFPSSEVLRRMVERWAAHQPLPPPPIPLRDRVS
jgi:type IV pilus assembly protein PilB